MQKGQRVKIGEPVKVSFFRQVAPGATLMYEDILYACDEDVCPEYTKDPRMLTTPFISLSIPSTALILTHFILHRYQGSRHPHIRSVPQKSRKGL